MHCNVFVPITFLRESSPATLEVALERFFSSMNSQMIEQIVPAVKLFATILCVVAHEYI